MLRGRKLLAARVFGLVAGGVASLIGLVALLYFTSAHFQAGTSDEATVILEGQAIAHGRVLLEGWNLTSASYWTSNAVFDGVAILVSGLRAALLYATPAVAGALAVAVGLLLAREGRRGWPGLAGGVAVVALLAFATPALGFLFVGRGFHVSTAVYALLAFLALRRARFGWGWALAVLLLTAGILGDLLMVAYGVIPLLLAGLVATWRERKLLAGMVELTAAAASVVLARVAHLVFVSIGTFTTAPARRVARFSQMVTNLGHAPVYAASLLGLTNVVVNSRGVPAQLGHMQGFDIANAIGALCVLACFVVALVSLVAALVRRRPQGRVGDGEPALWRLDNILVFAVICSAAPFVLLAGPNGEGIRYLTASVVFAVVLAGRVIARVWPKPGSGRSVRAFALAGTVLALGLVASFGYAMSGPQMSNSATQLAAWLETHDLHEGIGGYWVASITTVESGGDVAVRPVETGCGGQIERARDLTSSDWYEGKKFQFLVYGAPSGYRGIRGATTTWGSPKHVYVVGRYRVLVWNHEVGVAASSPRSHGRTKCREHGGPA
ncbi:MAG: hypothetical protein WAL35_04775 [Acidimicrobiales bacterium]